MEGQEEQPRTLLVSAPYALKAGDAETLGGKPISAFQLVSPQSHSSIGLKAAPAAEQANEITCAGTATCKTGFVPLFSSNGGSAKVSDSIVSQSGSNVKISGGENVTGNVGIGASPGSFQLQVTAPNQLGAAVQGPFTGVGAGLDLDTTGSGGKSWEILATGKGSAQGASKFNIRDLATSTDVLTVSPATSFGTDAFVGIDNTNPVARPHAVMNTSFGTAILGENRINNGAGAVTGLNSGNVDFASGVVGSARSTNGITYGVNGTNVSTDFLSAGVEGDSFATSGPTLGTVGTVASPNGTAVWGLALGRSNTGRGMAAAPWECGATLAQAREGPPA